MKKLIFLVHFGDIKKSSGIIEKVYNQSIAMHELGFHYKTYIFIKKEQENDIQLFKNIPYIKFITLDYFTKENSFIKNYIIIKKIFEEYKKTCIKESKNFDYIYVRMNPLYPGFLKFIKKFKNKIIFEHNSIEIEEYKANNQKKKVLFSKLFDKIVRKYAIGFVSVSKEIYDYQYQLYHKKGLLIPNGIDVNSFKIRSIPNYDNLNLNMIFVGNIRYWHGIERIINALKNYNGEKNIIFNICGLINQDDDYLSPLINSVKKNNIIINLLGYKTKDELNKYFDDAHIAIGCLGGYKKKINYGSVLKNREYFSRGIPIVFSEIDDDISIEENNGLYLQVPNNDSEIDLNTIIQFVENFYLNVEENTKRIRKFAEEHLDYNKKMLKFKEYINELDK